MLSRLSLRHNAIKNSLTKCVWSSAQSKQFSSKNKDKSDVLSSIDPEREKFDNFLKNVPNYEESLDDHIHPYFMQTDPIEGYATAEGTLRYMRRNDDEIPTSNFRTPYKSDLKLSSVGIGTYVGAPDDKTDYLMYDAIKTSVLSGGINVIDTAINYRYQKSERTVGKVVNSLVSKYGYERDELFICSKGGFIPDDADHGMPGRVIVEDLIKAGELDKSDVINGYVHCMHPKFLETQLNQSLKNMGLETLDLYYLHNAYEMQGPNNTDNVVMDRFAAAFEFLEKAVQRGQIKNYGMATWLCFRSKSSEEKIHLNLQKIIELAEKVAGKDHHFNYIQVPINVMMPEAFIEPWQDLEELDENGNTVSTKEMLVAACNMLKMNLISSQPLFQGRLAELNLPNKMGVFNTASRHLQLIRSIPTKCLVSTLVGMKDPRNVKYNLEVVRKPPMEREEWFDILKPKKRVEHIDDNVED